MSVSVFSGPPCTCNNDKFVVHEYEMWIYGSNLASLVVNEKMKLINEINMKLISN